MNTIKSFKRLSKDIERFQSDSPVCEGNSTQEDNVKFTLSKYVKNKYSKLIDRKKEQFQVQSFNLELSTSNMLLQYFKDKESEYLFKLIEDILMYAFHLSTCASKTQYALATLSFVKMRTNKSILMNPMVKSITDKLTTLFGVEEVQSATSFFESAHKLLDSYEEVKSIPIFPKMYKFFMYCLSLSLFDKLGITFDKLKYTKVEQEALKSKFHLGPDFVHCMLDTTLFVCERGYQCMLTGELDPIFHSGSKYEEWFKEAIEIKRKSHFISNPEPHGFSRFEFLSDLNTTLEKGAAILKHAYRCGEYEKKMVGSLIADLEMIKATEVTRKAAQQDRKAPFSILISGGSSVAKSTITQILFQHYGKLFNLPTTSEFKYTRNPIDQYWVNFNSTQWCVQLDDIAFLNPNTASAGDPSLMEMLQVVNNVPFVPIQADLADKGKTPLTSRFVIATTNTEHLNVFSYFSCPLAVQRRLPWIVEVKPKPQYSKFGVMLDSTLVPEVNEGEYPDYWIFIVKRVIPNGATVGTAQGKYETLFETQDIYTFLQWFSVTARDYEGVQNKVEHCNKVISNIKLCSLCDNPSIRCNCVPQSFDLESYCDTAWVQQCLKDRYNLNVELPPAGNILSWWGTCLVYLYFFLIFMYFKNTFIKYVMVKTRAMDWIIARMHIYCLTTGMYSQLFGLLGERVCKKIGDITFIKKLSLAVATMGVTLYTVSQVYKFIFPRNDEVQTAQSKPLYEEKCSLENFGERPTLPNGVEERVNIWYKNDFELTNFDITPQTTSWKGITMEKFRDIIGNNSVFFEIYYTGDDGLKVRLTRALCIKSHTYLCNNHAIPTGNFEIKLIQSSSKDGVTPNLQFRVSQSDIYRDVDRDLCYIKIENLPPKKDISGLFAKETLKGIFKGYYVGRERDGSQYFNVVDKVQLHEKFEYCAFDKFINSWKGIAQRPTKVGDCGSALFVVTPVGPIILGIHCLGNADTHEVVSLQVTTDMFEHAHTWLYRQSQGYSVQAGCPMLDPSKINGPLGSLHHKSSVRFVQEGSADIYGSFQGFRPRMNSCVKQTLLEPYVRKRGYRNKFTKPDMTNYMAWHNNLKECTKPIVDFDNDIMYKCYETFLQHLKGNLGQEFQKELLTYDDMTAINGYPGLKYVDAINKNTSAGYPWNKSKKYYLKHLAPLDVWQDPVKVDDEVVSRMHQMMKTYEAGYRVCPVMTASLKDEPIKFEKARANKIRVFMGAPLDFSLLVRKLYLSHIRVFQKNRFLFLGAPGTVCQSLEWEQIREWLVHFGEDQIVAGDYKMYDKKMPPIVIKLAMYLLTFIKHNMTPQEIQMKLGVCEDLAYTLCNFNGDLMQFFGVQSSGNPLTVIINCIANVLYMLYCFYVLCPDNKVELNMFFKLVHLMTYGDDNVMGVSKTIPWFNHTSISRVLASVGIEYTMADKTSESRPYIHIDEASFLKRTWRWDSDVGAYLCPLEHDSIEKMLMICVESKTICAEQHSIAVISTALREYFYYGREIFEKKRKMFEEILEEANLKPYMDENTLPTYTFLKKQFWEMSEGVEILRLSQRHPGFELKVDVSTLPIDWFAGYDNEKILSQNKLSHDSYCVQSEQDTDSTRVDHGIYTLGRSPQSVFTDGTSLLPNSLQPSDLNSDNGLEVKELTNEEFYQKEEELMKGCVLNKCGRCIVTNCPMKNFYTKYVMRKSIYEVQSREISLSDEGTEEILRLSNEQIGALVRGTWVPGHYIKYKRMLFRSLQDKQTFNINVLSREEKQKLILQLHHSLDLSKEEGDFDNFVQGLVEEAKSKQKIDSPLSQEFEAQCCEFEIQSAEVDYVPKLDKIDEEQTESQKHQTVEFMDKIEGEKAEFNPISDSSFYADCTPGVELAEFLSRPVPILSTTWTQASSPNVALLPWYLFLNDTRIKKKLDNYAFISCNLKIKVVVNASPFCYGAAILSYLPFTSFNPGTVPATTADVVIPYSQRPHVWIYPQSCSGGELTLPFFYSRNWLDLTDGTAISGMGALTLYALTNLLSANGSATTSANITVYAWAEDVRLAGPTVRLAVQSDEYDGEISGPASALAATASRLRNLPIIGRYARATEVGARAVASISSVFGYTDVPVINSVEPIKSQPFHAMSSAHISTPVDKLSLDPKAELTIDPRTTGLPERDELALPYLLQKQSYLCLITWPDSAIPGDLIFSSAIHPCLRAEATIANSGGCKMYDSPPMAHIQYLFANWRGDIIFTFKFICTKYHKGRLRITYDPRGDIIADANSTSVCFTKIVDLSVEDEIEVRIPYMQQNAWLRNSGSMNQAQYWKTSSFSDTTASGFTNGLFTIRILNELSGPVTPTSVYAMCFVKGAENLEFANPRELPTNASLFAPQSAEYTVKCVAGKEQPIVNERYLINYGESVSSLRPLLRRTACADVVPFANYTSTTAYQMLKVWQTAWPIPYGFNTSGYSSAKGIKTGTTGTDFPFSFTQQHPFCWIVPMFVGMRGSMNWHYNADGYGTNGTIPGTSRLMRRVEVAMPAVGVNGNIETQTIATAASHSAYNNFFYAYFDCGNAGHSLTNTNTQTGLGVNLPFMSRYRMVPTYPPYLARGGGSDSDNNLLTFTWSSVMKPSRGGLATDIILQKYASIGPDFNVFMFLNIPTTYYYAPTIVPT